jgi:hypothetical protein
MTFITNIYLKMLKDWVNTTTAMKIVWTQTNTEELNLKLNHNVKIKRTIYEDA